MNQMNNRAGQETASGHTILEIPPSGQNATDAEFALGGLPWDFSTAEWLFGLLLIAILVALLAKLFSDKFPEKQDQVISLDGGDFKNKLGELTTPKELYYNVPRIYAYLGEIFKEDCTDSLKREWAFQWLADNSSKSYKEIHDRWLTLFDTSHASPEVAKMYAKSAKFE